MADPVDPTFLEPVNVRILILTDHRLSFDSSSPPSAYSLALFIEGLNQLASPVVRFSIKKAYRKSRTPQSDDSNGKGSDFPDFRFLNEDLRKDYDEVWIFGDQQEQLDDNCEPKIPTTQLTGDEVRILYTFMQNDGGVFATGDHESIGASIGAHLPRVRSMRTWRDGPGVISPTRHNTTLGVSERDDKPQVIIPSSYRAQGFRAYPHPLLSGPNGTISVLPDHIHEGTCREGLDESDLAEYPARGIPRPVIVAKSIRGESPDKTVPFPAIAAYDGHLVDVGRIVVDASFHHFVQDNLAGFLPQPPPAASNVATTAYEDIKSYHRNIGIWLAPPDKQREMFLSALWHVRWRSVVHGLLVPETGTINASEIRQNPNPDVVLGLGKEARNALERLTSLSFILLWSVETFKRVTGDDPSFSSLYPWLHGNESGGNPLSVSTSEELIQFMIGGVMIELAFKYPTEPVNFGSTFINDLKDVVRGGALVGLRALKAKGLLAVTPSALDHM